MSYCSQADLIIRFGEGEMLDLAADETGMTLDAALVERACVDAAGEIDGRIAAGGYAVPLSPVPRIVTAYACDIARYRLYEDRATEQVTRRYQDAIKFLGAVASGKVKLGIDSHGSHGDGDPTSGGVQFSDSRRVFGGGGF